MSAPVGVDTPLGDRPAGAGGPTRVEIIDVDLRLFPDSRIHVIRLAGIASSVRRGQPVTLDDKNAYEIDVEGAETRIGWADLSTVLNEYTFAFDDAPVHDLKLAREEDEDERDEVELKGNLQGILGLSF